MRSSLRLLNLEASALQGPRPRYVCSTCRQSARPRPLVARQFLRHASDNSTPITERVRRKLWGTDKPPGLEDPYGDNSVLWKKKEGGAAPEPAEPPKQAEEPVEEPTSGDYEPALDGKGLARVGHLGRWKDLPPKAADAYNPFFQRRLTSPGHLAIAAHQTAVELALMYRMGRRVTDICEVVEHEKPIFDLIYNTRFELTTGERPTTMVHHESEEAKEALNFVFSQIGSPHPAKQSENVKEIEPQTETVAETEATAEAEAEADLEAAPEEAQSSPAPASTSPFFGYRNIKDKGVLQLDLPPKYKFAFLKRFTQLTGHRIPDVHVAEMTKVKDVLKYLNKELAPKPKKLGEHLALSQKLRALPNVKISVKKVRPSDRDEELGRKKIIDAELRRRELIW
ncbi:ribosomal subunit 39S-domain-containing protein [Aspergillus venezuelensis]